MIRILDLFCGLGGVARGFQKYLLEQGIDFEYHAVDNDTRILLAHKIINPYSTTIRRNAWNFSKKELKEYNLVWASPPCETHSQLMLYNSKDSKKFKEPDMRLWQLISRLYSLNIPFIVENVRPYYGFLIKPTVKVHRHVLWSNLSIKPFKVDLPSFGEVKDDIRTLVDYHELNDVFPKIKTLMSFRKLGDALRDMVHWRISYNIAKQVIPQLLDGKKVIQLVLTSSSSLGGDRIW